MACRFVGLNLMEACMFRRGAQLLVLLALLCLFGLAACGATTPQWKKSVACLEVEGFALVAEGIEQGKVVGPGTYVGIVHGKSAGTGFFIDDKGTMVTNAHVIRRATRVLAKMEDKSMVDVSNLLAVDPEADIAILRSEKAPRISSLRFLLAGQVQKDQPILVVGNSMDLGLSLYRGTVTNILDEDKGSWVIVNADYRQGASGGPVFDEKGNLISVVAASVPGLGTMGMTVPAWKVRRVVDGTTGIAIDKPVGEFYTEDELNQRLKTLGVRDARLESSQANMLLFGIEQTRDYVFVLEVLEGDVGFGINGQPIARLKGQEEFMMALTATESGILEGFLLNLGSEPAKVRFELAVVEW